MISTTANTQTVAYLEGADPGVVTARLEDGDEQLATAVTVSLVVDTDGDQLATWKATFTPDRLPVEIVWLLDEGTAEEFVALRELVVAEVVVGPVVGEILPTVDEVALLLRTRTVGGQAQGGLGSDTGPADLTTFDEGTRPKASEVARVIQTAAGAVLSKLVVGQDDLPFEHFGGVRHAVELYSVMLVGASFFADSIPDSQLEFWRDLAQETINGVNAAIEATQGSARTPTFGTLRIGDIRTRPAPNHDPVEGIDF